MPDLCDIFEANERGISFVDAFGTYKGITETSIEFDGFGIQSFMEYQMEHE
jgi:purine-nucleoside phosphorylase